MNIKNITIVDFEVNEKLKSLSGTCKVEATYNDGFDIANDVGELFEMHAYMSDEGVIKSRGDLMITGDELDDVWKAVTALAKKTLAESLV